jgi:hypothetical protein
VQSRSSSALQQLRSKVNKCKRESEKALCPLEARSGAEIYAGLTGGPLPGSLRDINAEVFRRDFAPQCARPSGAVSRAASDCAKRVRQAATQVVVDAQRCLFDCEVSRISRGGELCVDPATGHPSKDKVRECLDEALADADSLLRSKCSDALLAELGCPAGAATSADLAADLFAAAGAIAEPLNLGLFHARCRENPRPPVELPPPVAPVTLLPRRETRQIPCGQVIDKEFMAGSRTLVLEADLSCEAVNAATDGLVIDVSNITIDGKGKWSIVGPASSRYRTGAGIRLAPGARKLRIRRIQQIRRFGHGIVDSGTNRGLQIEDLNVFRNVIAGVSIASDKVRIENVTADRNTIGFELEGDDAEIKESIARGSTPAPGIGVRLAGVDKDRNDTSASVRESAIEGNMIGVLVEGEAGRVSGSTVDDSLGVGIEVTGALAKIDQNSVKRSAGDGIVVGGIVNAVRKNRIEESGGAGVLVLGFGNAVRNNTAGTPNGRGNAGAGFEVAGDGAVIHGNKAEGNGSAGFAIAQATAKLKGNRARLNAGEGFLIAAPGNLVDSNVAASNGGAELVVAPGNQERPGSNRVNGATVSFGAQGGTFE